MSKNATLLMVLTMGLWQISAAIAVLDHSPDGKAIEFRDALQEGVHHRRARADKQPRCRKADQDTDLQEGSVYGYTWVKFNGGVKLQGDSLVTMHLLGDDGIDTSRHGFPDIQAKIIPPKVNVGDNLQVWHQGQLYPVSAVSHLLVASKFGIRTIWGAVPAFQFDCDLIPGSPIFRDGKLVSVITKSDGKGKYAVSGISEVSGHFASDKVRVRTMTATQAVYGRTIGSYAEIKTEATRVKKNTNEPEHYEIVVGVGTLRLVGWSGDNLETFHARIGPPRGLTIAE